MGLHRRPARLRRYQLAGLLGPALSTVGAHRAERQRRTVLAVSVDNAAEIDDALGAAALGELCDRLARRVRRTPEPVRLLGRDDRGGLSLQLLTSDAGVEQELVAALHETLTHPVQVRGQQLWPVVSIGVRTGHRSTPVADLLADARLALSAARTEGTGRLHWFEPALRERAEHRLRTTGELVTALNSGDQLVLHYQPVHDLGTGAVVAAEALVRWQHPTRGLLLPGTFLDIAEQAGLLPELGRVVRERALAQVARWRAAGATGLRVHVNVAPVEFHEPGFVDGVLDALQRHDVPASALLLEITETGLMTGGSAVTATLHRLREAGVGLGIDDFGTGYSSIGYLHDLPVDTVKLDRSLVAGIASSPQEFALTRAVLGLLGTRGVTVQAEGVETAGQVAHLRALHCRQAQGFHLSRPMPAGRLTALLSGPGPLVATPTAGTPEPAVRALRPADSALLEPAAEGLQVAG